MALPSPIHPSFAGRLDDDFVAFYNAHLAIKPETHGLAFDAVRAAPAAHAAPWNRDFSYEPFVNDVRIRAPDGHEFAVRVYAPDARTAPEGAGPYSVYVNFHGGGWTFGSLQGDAELCMLIRNRVGIMVVDVDYRLCPENTFLRGHDDCWTAVRWIVEHGREINARPDSISVGGISAGGHIAAVIQQLARDANIDLRLAILAVPSTTCPVDLHETPSPYASYAENALAPCLNLARMRYFAQRCAPATPAQRAELAARPRWHRSPMDGDARRLCATLVLTAECDPLRDEGEAYAARLVAAGVRVTQRRYTRVAHPFMHMLTLRKARAYVDDVCAELRRAHAL